MQLLSSSLACDTTERLQKGSTKKRIATLIIGHLVEFLSFVAEGFHEKKDCNDATDGMEPDIVLMTVAEGFHEKKDCNYIFSYHQFTHYRVAEGFHEKKDCNGIEFPLWVAGNVVAEGFHEKKDCNF